MSKIRSHFSCMICEEVMKILPNTHIVDFTISLLQFHKDHEKCERLEQKLMKEPDAKIDQATPQVEAKAEVMQGQN